MPDRPRERPRDPNELAKRVVDEATGEQPKYDPAAVARGRSGGLKGGRARAAKLTAEQRSAIAKKAAETRWGRASQENRQGR